MAGGWTRDGAVQDQIDDTVTDAVLAARARMPRGPSAEHCDLCGEDIPEKRRAALPGVRVLGFTGALNSTSKLVIEAMEQGGSFQEGLEHARRLGVAEAERVERHPEPVG